MTKPTTPDYRCQFAIMPVRTNGPSFKLISAGAIIFRYQARSRSSFQFSNTAPVQKFEVVPSKTECNTAFAACFRMIPELLFRHRTGSHEFSPICISATTLRMAPRPVNWFEKAE